MARRYRCQGAPVSDPEVRAWLESEIEAFNERLHKMSERIILARRINEVFELYDKMTLHVRGRKTLFTEDEVAITRLPKTS